MIYLFGNCQMDFLGRSLAGLGIETDFRPLATPLGPLSSGGQIPPELLEWAGRFDLADHLHSRTLKNQFQAITPDDPSPELLVVNLFHENEPLFAHQDGWIFFVDPSSWIANPDFEAWMKASFRQVKLPTMDYFNRWAQFVAALRSAYPQTPIIISTQLSHYPAFGPDPFSYLACWQDTWREAGPFLAQVAAELGNCHLLDADRVFAGIWRQQGDDMDEHCPFFKIRLEGNGSGPKPVMQRDLEHVGPLWPAMAVKVAEFLASGGLHYAEAERIPEDWSRPYSPKSVSPRRMRHLLASGNNYSAARAVNAFFHDLETDYTPLLAECAEAMPVCHSTLHMIHRYSMLKPSLPLIEWCHAHRERAATFEDNGSEFRRRYLERIEQISSAVLMQAAAGGDLRGDRNPGLH